MIDPESVMVAAATQKYPRNSEGDIAQLRDGRLLLVWTRFYGGAADHAAAEIAGMFSEDEGRSWGESFLVVENDAQQNVMSASLLRAGNGDLLLFYLRKNSDSDLKAVVRRSQDEAQSWGEETIVTPGPGYHVMNNARVVRLSTGRLLAPVAWTEEAHGEKAHYLSLCFISDDDGRTWRKGPGIVDLPKRGAMEPGLVELKDGRVLMIIRTQLGTIHRAYSHDGGENWTEPEPSGLRSPEAPATIARIPSTGELLLCWNNSLPDPDDHWGPRTPLTLAVSRDEGRTWEGFRDLETNKDHGYAYTSITFVGQVAVLSYWDQDEAGVGLRVTRVPLEWLKTGR